ncbi:MAG: phosphoglycerate dehydrogenase, partial [Proteobacteria bacterium]|nr:phosphoglycerate dehydrogenase [Pseudomonadota bacterium]
HVVSDSGTTASSVTVVFKVLGLIGFGKIGSIVADRARGLKMRVIIHDPFVQSDIIEKAGYESVTLEDLYKKADYITVHVPKLKDTAGLLDKKAFDQMKDGVMVINCARGGIINEDDLYDAMKSGKVAGAALDVFATEPPGKIKLLELDNLVCTPHLGASTLEAQTNVAVQVAGQIIDYLQNGTILNAVNTPSVTGELLVKLGPYLSLANQMGLLLAQLGKGALKEVEIEFNGDFQGLDMSPVTTALIKGLLSPILKDDVNFINALIIAGERGIKISESTNPESKEYMNLVSVKAVTDMGTNSVAGTIFGKRDSRVVRINTFRLEMVLKGHLALIYNIDKPGSIGQIGTVLGKHNVNIARMQVGQEEKGDRNIIFLCTDSAIPDNVLEELRGLSLVKSVTPFQF